MWKQGHCRAPNHKLCHVQGPTPARLLPSKWHRRLTLRLASSAWLPPKVVLLAWWRSCCWQTTLRDSHNSLSVAGAPQNTLQQILAQLGQLGAQLGQQSAQLRQQSAQLGQLGAQLGQQSAQQGQLAAQQGQLAAQLERLNHRTSPARTMALQWNSSTTQSTAPLQPVPHQDTGMMPPDGVFPATLHGNCWRWCFAFATSTPAPASDPPIALQ